MKELYMGYTLLALSHLCDYPELLRKAKQYPKDKAKLRACVLEAVGKNDSYVSVARWDRVDYTELSDLLANDSFNVDAFVRK